MIPNPPEKSVWLDIPDTCRMRGEFTGDRDIQIMFGNPNDGVNVLFERLALERFVQLANELLALQIPDDPKADLTGLNTLLGRYVLRFFDADAGRAEPVSIEDEQTLSGCRWPLTAFGRELPGTNGTATRSP